MTRLRFIPALLAASLVVLFASCAPQVGSARWCEQMKERSAAEWSLSEAGDFAKHCLLPSTTIGSPRWCEEMRKLPKGDWSTNQATDYARHCLVGSG